MEHDKRIKGVLVKLLVDKLNHFIMLLAVRVRRGKKFQFCTVRIMAFPAVVCRSRSAMLDGKFPLAAEGDRKAVFAFSFSKGFYINYVRPKI